MNESTYKILDTLTDHDDCWRCQQNCEQRQWESENNEDIEYLYP